MAVTRHDIADALAAYWGKKTLQMENSRIAGAVGAGTAGSIRGGAQFDPVAAIIAKFFIEAGFPASAVQAKDSLGLPGYYRPSKQWDVVVTIGNTLVAAFEMKALGGPSFGNNANNRIEEALGSAVDIQRGALADLYPGESPWLGYLFVMEDAPGSQAPVTINRMAMPADPLWTGMSYQDRFGVTLQRLRDERLYDAVCYLISSPDNPGPLEPVPALDWDHFTAAINARISYLQELGYPDNPRLV